MVSPGSLYGERMARVETELKELKAAFNEHKIEVNSKLDELLALKYKGAGAFWLASALIGTGIVGFITQIFHFFGGR
jgi:hypothetical protein